MRYFAAEVTGVPAFLIMLGLAYLLIYLPIKLTVTLIAYVKQKNDRLRRLQQRTVIAEYEPPHNLAPAEMGFMYDAKLSSAEVFGTMVSLEHKGLVVISENEKGLQITGAKPVLPDLKEFEKLILQHCTNHLGQNIDHRMLKSIRIKADLVIKKQLQVQGYLATTTEQIKKSFLRLGLIMLGLIALTALITHPSTASGISTLIFFTIFLLPVYFVMSIFLYFVIQKVAGEPWLGTPKLKQVWPDIEGFRLFIQQVELDNLQFDSENTKGIIKNKTLPFAIALGFNTGWLDKIK